jgi:hypothetical protein
MVLFGWGEPCRADADCMGQTVCADGHCQSCAADSDCSGDAPHCASYMQQGTLLPILRCAECRDDADCGPERPHCSLLASGDPGRCVECGSTQPCATGICAGERCVPGCSSDANCEPWQTCSANQRCEVRSCTSAADCPTHYACTTGRCAPRTCAGDAGCDAGGVCVLGICRTMLGSCLVEQGVP